MIMEVKLVFVGIGLFLVAFLMRSLRNKVKEGVWQKIYREALDWIETGWSAVLLAAFLMYFFVQAFKIPSGSMRMTFLEGDHLFVNKFFYGFHVPFANGLRFWKMHDVKRGEILVFECPPAALSPSERDGKVLKDFVKRCVAVGGDVVQVKNKKLFINGSAVEEPYADFVDQAVYPSVKIFANSEEYQRAWEQGKFDVLPPNVIRDNFGPIIVPPGNYFVMGDNRDRSFDSRFWGPLEDHFIKGRPFFMYWPPKRVHVISYKDKTQVKDKV